MVIRKKTPELWFSLHTPQIWLPACIRIHKIEICAERTQFWQTWYHWPWWMTCTREFDKMNKRIPLHGQVMLSTRDNTYSPAKQGRNYLSESSLVNILIKILQKTYKETGEDCGCITCIVCKLWIPRIIRRRWGSLPL